MIVADPHRRPTWAVPALAAIALALGACGPHHRLADFQYPGHTLSVVTESPPSPEFLSGIGRSGRGSTIGRIADVVGRVLTGVDAFGLEAKLDTVSDQVDVTALMEDRLLRRGSRYLGAEPVPGDPHADYILEVHVRSYGIDADGWEDRAWAFVDATAVLLDGSSGTEIWAAGVVAEEAVTPALFGGRFPLRGAVTAAMLADLTVEELAEVMESIANYAADHVVDRLREDLRDVRDP